MQTSFKKIALVTLGLIAIGALCGAVLGAIATIPEVIAEGGLQGSLVGLGYVALIGAMFGSVLAPLVAWIFLRRISIARAVGETTAGVLIGIVAGAITQPTLCAPLGLLGFVAAGMRLWLSTRRTTERHREPAI